MNPGGSIKDRAAKYIINDAIKEGKLTTGGRITEGTVGSTGIALGLLANVLGYNCDIFMPDDVAKEKSDLLKILGCEVHRVPPVSIINPGHYVNQAKKYGEKPNSNLFFSNQFENLSNFNAHYNETGPEIWQQTQEANIKIDAIIMGAGTGGTLSGITTYLKEKDPSIKSFLVDPVGSGLFNRVNAGVMYANEEGLFIFFLLFLQFNFIDFLLAEGTRKRHQTDSILEGVGINRLTKNFEISEKNISKAFRCFDDEAVRMSRYLIKREGLFLGGSSALNCVGAVKLAKHLNQKDAVIITVLCDGGHRYVSNLYNDEYLTKRHINTQPPSHPTLKYVLPDEFE